MFDVRSITSQSPRSHSLNSLVKTVHVSQLWGKARYVYHKLSTLLLVVDGS